MKNHPTLYKLDSKGKTREWRLQSEGAKFRTVAGIKGGSLVTSEWTTCVEKNVGRSNATTPEQQCQAEVAAKYVKKKNQGGYHATLDTIEQGSSYTEPMLAKTYKGEVKSFPVLVQPKLDGIRCIVKLDQGDNKIKMWTRRGKPIVSCQHITEVLEQTGAFTENPDLILDGELYNHDLKDDFQKIVSLVRRQTCTATDFAETRKLVQYHMYDSPVQDVYATRRDILEYVQVQSVYTEGAKGCIQVVPSNTAKTLEHLDFYHGEAIKEGYEGSMIRDPEAPYQEGKRSPALLKRKDFDTDEFTIVDILPGIGNRSGVAGKIEYRTLEGKPFESGIRGNMALFKTLLENKETFIGSQATVRYFGFTDEGKPRHAVTVDLHDGERQD